jgi:hypothetical protein
MNGVDSQAIEADDSTQACALIPIRLDVPELQTILVRYIQSCIKCEYFFVLCVL